jgi:hypothetical protein
VEAFHKIIVSIGEKEALPKEGNTGLIFKKGDKLEYKNYRGIMLLSIVYKVLSCIILEHINQYAESVLEEYQCGFRHGRSAVEQIFIICQLMEKCFEFNIDLHRLYFDYKKAFDNVTRTELLSAMGSCDISKKLVRPVEMTVKDSDAKITIGGNISKSFNVLQGVRQGDGLSAVLFNLTLD